MSKDNRLKILIVEDSEIDTQVILGMLEKIIYKTSVFIVNNGQDALDFLKNEGTYKNKKDHPPQIDLILLDVMMPKMDGSTFVRKIKKIDILKNIPIIVFTTEKGLKDNFQIEGVNDYVLKSLDGSDLIKKINRYTQIST